MHLSDEAARQRLELEERTWYATHDNGEVWPGPEEMDPVDAQ